MALLNYLGALLLMCTALSVRTRWLRQALMLAASYIFYAVWGATFLAILIGSSIFNFAIGQLLRRNRTLPLLCSGIAGNVLLLAIFKYFPAFTTTLSVFSLPRLVMPIGMSFWTFQ